MIPLFKTFFLARKIHFGFNDNNKELLQ